LAVPQAIIRVSDYITNKVRLLGGISLPTRPSYWPTKASKP